MKTKQKNELRKRALSYYRKFEANLRRRLNDRTVASNRKLRSYVESHFNETKLIKETVSDAAFLNTALKKDIVFFGNFRSDNRVRESFLYCMKAFKNKKIKFTVGIDLFTWGQNKDIKNYLNGRISSNTLISKIDMDSPSNLPVAESYLPILNFCAKGKIPVCAFDYSTFNSDRLKQRDELTAKRIVRHKDKNKNSVLLCLLPDSWLAKGHVPLHIERICEKRAKFDTIKVFSGSHDVYMKLASGMKENVRFIRTGKNVYVSNQSHPVLRYNYFFNYLDGVSQIEDPKRSKADFEDILEAINRALNLKISVKKLRYRLYSNFEIDFIERILSSKIMSDKEKEETINYVSREEGYFLPKEKTIYLGNLSRLQAAEEAAHYIRYVLCGIERAKTHEDVFYVSLLNEAFAYLASKFIIPARRPLGKEVLRAALKDDLSEEERENLLAHSLGYELGEKLYKMYKGSRPGKTLRNIFSARFSKQGDAKRFYDMLLLM